jgi:hypothetical protein
LSCDSLRYTNHIGTIATKAKVITPRTKVNLGDSVAFYSEVPDNVALDGKPRKSNSRF